MIAITVFTPTYNRAATLPRVHESLRRQTLDPSRFEWIIVDDGSTDGTGDLVRSWESASFAVRYFWQANRGKHVAWNRAVKEARGDLFAVLDSDDACTPDALERFVSLWDALTPERKTSLAGILVRCQTPEGVPIGPPLPPVDTADFAELAFLYGLPTETWSAARTEVLEAHPFPELRVPLVPEGVVWLRVARRHRWLVRDECLRVYYSGEHGMAGQLSRLSPWRYPAGMALMQRTVLDEGWRFVRKAPLAIMRAAVHFDRFSLHAGAAIRQEIGSLEHGGARALSWAALPAGYAMYVVDHLRHRAVSGA